MFHTPSVFISYRDNDAPHVVDRVVDHLGFTFGHGRVRRVREAGEVHRRDVFVVVMGPDWSPSTMANPDDPLRHELERAALSGNPILPVLVQGTAMPSQRQLPPAVQPVLERHVASIRTRDPGFREDMDDLLKRIRLIHQRTQSPLVGFATTTAGSVLLTGLCCAGPIFTMEGMEEHELWVRLFLVAGFFLGVLSTWTVARLTWNALKRQRGQA